MPNDVIMPQMGESIFEGTITKWLKKPGERVQRDEPLFEISTDKVDAEIPAPASGVLREVKFPEGATVQVNTVVAVIDEQGAGAGAAAPARPEPAKPAGTAKGEVGAAPSGAKRQPPPITRVVMDAPPPPQAVAQAEGAPRAEQPPATEAAVRREQQRPAAPQEEAEVIEFPEGGRVRSSPLVRRIAREHGVNLAEVAGTGMGGRITKEDIMGYVQQRGQAGARPTAAALAGRAAPTPAAAAEPVAILGELVPMTPMRKRIAERMVESKRTSPHVHTVYEVDMTKVAQLRQRLRGEWEQRNGTRLTFTAFAARATVAAIRQYPIVNASVEGDSIRYHQHINLGIAVALDWGLIVPIIKNAEELNFLGLQRAINELSERARTKRLLPDDVSGGTFTITNPGSIGGVFGMPIIMQPQVAILGLGGIKKTPVVVTAADGSDSIAIRSIMHLVLGYDHRIIDGATAGMFLGAMKSFLETWSEDIG